MFSSFSLLVVACIEEVLVVDGCLIAAGMFGCCCGVIKALTVLVVLVVIARKVERRFINNFISI